MRGLGLADIELEPWEEVIDPGGGDAPQFAACAREVTALIDELAPDEAGGPVIRATADEAAALLRPVDTSGMPLGPGQPPAFLEALGRRTDWEDLRIGGALLTVLTDLFSHPGVHYLSGFYGPLERMLRDGGANIGFAPADFRRFTTILEAAPPRVMCTVGGPARRGRVVQPLAPRRGVGRTSSTPQPPTRTGCSSWR